MRLNNVKRTALLIYVFIFLFDFMRAQPGLSFSLHIVSASSSITCSTPSVNVIATSTCTDLVYYNWLGPGSSLFGDNVYIATSGTYTVFASSVSTSSAMQTVFIGLDTTTPVSSLSPSVLSITCNSTVPNVTVNTTLTNNLSHLICSPWGGTFAINTASGTYKPGGPGTFTHVLVNNQNGCKTSHTFQVNGSGFPTFNLVSPENFTLGCNTKSIATININNAITTPTAGGPLSYTLFGPGTTTAPSGPLSSITGYTTNVPGSYVVITRDNTSHCDTRLPFTIFANNQGPDYTAIVPTQTLDCNIPYVQLQVTSPEPSITYIWNSLSTFTVGGNTLTAVSNTALPGNTTANIYTLTVINDNSFCSTSTVIPIYQNIFRPNAQISNGGINAITCKDPTLALTNISTSGIPQGTFTTTLSVVSTLWKGPLPQNPVTYAPAYIAFTPGIYTMTALDLNNGCISQDTAAVFDGRIYPVVNNPNAPPPFCVNSNVSSVVISPTIGSHTHLYTYQWTAPAGASLSVTDTESVTAVSVGIYSVVVKDSTSGCSTLGQLIVNNCFTGVNEYTRNGVHVSVYPNPFNGLFFISLNKIKENSYIEIYNCFGASVKKQIADSDKIIVDLDDRPKGLYFVYLYQGTKPVFSTKMIKE
jgi:hypothetical protein